MPLGEVEGVEEVGEEEQVHKVEEAQVHKVPVELEQQLAIDKSTGS